MEYFDYLNSELDGGDINFHEAMKTYNMGLKGPSPLMPASFGKLLKRMGYVTYPTSRICDGKVCPYRKIKKSGLYRNDQISTLDMIDFEKAVIEDKIKGATERRIAREKRHEEILAKPKRLVGRPRKGDTPSEPQPTRSVDGDTTDDSSSDQSDADT